MTAKEKLASYIERRIYPDRREDFLAINQLRPIMHGVQVMSPIERLHPHVMESVLLHVTKVLRGVGIEPIHFKGLTLANTVYEQPLLRKTRDIDFLIPPGDYDTASAALLADGADIQEDYDGHHLTLNIRGVKVEMHTSLFHPGDGITLKLTDGDLRQMTLRNTAVTTLAPTALFVLLVLHYFTHTNKGGKYDDDKFLLQYYQKRRSGQLSRLLDIALTAEKFRDEIDWERCADMLRCASDNEVFALMLAEFEDAFPDTLPAHFVAALTAHPAVPEARHSIFRRIIAEHDRPYDDIIADAFRHSEQEYCCPSTEPEAYRFHIDEHDAEKPHSYVLSGIPPENSADLSYRFDLCVRDGTLHFYLNVTDNVLTYLPADTNPAESDAIGYCDSFTLCIVPDKRYVLNCIYAFLTQDDAGAVSLSCYDIGAITVPLAGTVQSTFTPRADGYTAHLAIPLSALGVTESDDGFYLNVIVSDCDDDRGSRTALALDPAPTAWDNYSTYPFLRIERGK